MPQDHDRRYKYLFSHAGFVRRLLEGFVDEAFVADLDFETLERVDGEFIDADFTRANLRRMRNAVAALFYFETTPVGEIEPHMRAIVDILKEEEPGLVSAFGNWLAHWAAQSRQSDSRLLRLKQALLELQEETVASLFERTLEEAYQKKRLEGLKRGLEEGHTKGIQEGRQEGHRAAAVKTARKLLARGMEPEEVAELVELSIEDVQALQREQS
jgi:predicted transposase/invertase (TIGR01784 family)